MSTEIKYDNFKKGLNIEKYPDKLDTSEISEGANFRISSDGKVYIRNGSKRYFGASVLGSSGLFKGGVTLTFTNSGSDYKTFLIYALGNKIKYIDMKDSSVKGDIITTTYSDLEAYFYKLYIGNKEFVLYQNGYDRPIIIYGNIYGLYPSYVYWGCNPICSYVMDKTYNGDPNTNWATTPMKAKAIQYGAVGKQTFDETKVTLSGTQVYLQGRTFKLVYENQWLEEATGITYTNAEIKSLQFYSEDTVVKYILTNVMVISLDDGTSIELESAGTSPISLTIPKDGATVELTDIPVPSAIMSYKRLYRTLPNGTVYFRVLRKSGASTLDYLGRTTTSFIDLMGDNPNVESELSINPLLTYETDGLYPTPIARYIANGAGRTWIAGLQGSQSAKREVYYLEKGVNLQTQTQIKVTNKITVYANENEIITAIVFLNNNLYVFTQTSTWVLYDGDVLRGLELLTDTVGCVNHKSIASTSGGVYLMTNTGYCYFNGSSFRNISSGRVNKRF